MKVVHLLLNLNGKEKKGKQHAEYYSFFDFLKDLSELQNLTLCL